jgi:glycosyltransferase involved in cell wall biosynthesis
MYERGTGTHVLSRTQYSFWREPIEALGVPVIWVGRSDSRLSRAIRIVRELRRDPPHILQSQHLFANLYVVLAARLLGISEIGAIRGDGISGVKRVGKVASYLTLRAPRIIASNSRNAIRNVTVEGVASKKLFLLPNVVDTELFECDRSVEDVYVRLVIIGRLVKPKRIDRYLNVLHKLVKKCEAPIRGIVVGDGELRATLKEQATALGLLPEHVMLAGKKDDVTPFYRQADIFVLTSDWEGTPNVVLEAMAAGLPVVATDVGGVSDLVIHGETGFLVGPDDEPAMIDRLLYLINNEERRKQMGRRAREYVTEHYSLEQLPMYLHKLYERALSGS